MSGIKHYTINFFGLGKVNKNDMLSVYLRYLYTYQGKKYRVSFATGYKLTPQQIVLLKANKLGGKTREELKKQESGLINACQI